MSTDPLELKYRAVITKSERTGAVGVMRAVIQTEKGEIALDLNTIIPATFCRQIRVEDYAEIAIRIRAKEDVDSELMQDSSSALPHAA